MGNLWCSLYCWLMPWLSLPPGLCPRLSLKLKPTLPSCIHILLALTVYYTTPTTLAFTILIMDIIFWEREALSLNPIPCTAKGEKLSPHPRLSPRLDLKGQLKPNPKLKLIPGITTIITMDTPIIIMGIMATLTTDVTGMANKFENSFSLIHTRKKVGKSWKTDPSDDNGQKRQNSKSTSTNSK